MVLDREATIGTQDHPQRLLSLDMARGLAVLGMIYVHFVPAEDGTTILERVCASLVQFLESKTAVLFCVLVGMTLALQLQRVRTGNESRFIVRRALVLAAGGVAMHFLVWSTEILFPLGLMMLVASVILRKGIKALVSTSVMLLIAAPAAFAWLGHYAITDWTEDDTHVGERIFGLATVRFIVFDGHYPLLPWTVFLLLGAALVRVGWNSPNRSKRWFWCGFIVWVTMQLSTGWVSLNEKILGNVAPYLESTWIPTTIPFVMLTGASAVTLIAGLSWCENSGRLLRAVMPVVLLGRASLTHYVVHICAVFAPLRLAFPDEDWPLSVGLSVAVAYVAIALPVTALWFRRYSRGPVEMLWAFAAGR